jgi:hypothetical protein
MKFFLQLISIVIVSYLAELVAPWYAIAFVALVFGFLLYSKANFLAGFLAIVILWSLKIWLTLSNTDTDLAARVAQIFPVQKEVYLILLTVFIGGLVGGFAALTGALLRPGKKNKYYR